MHKPHLKLPKINREWLYRSWQRLRPYLHICHLHRPVDLILLLIPALWAVGFNQGDSNGYHLAVLLLAATAVRCAAWVYNDLMDARQLPEAPESFVARSLVSEKDGWRIFGGLLLAAALLILPLGLNAFLWGSVALGLLLGYPHIKRRTLLTQAYLGLCFAWMIPMTHLIVPEIPVKGVWLLFTATLLWATANTLLYAIPRRGYQERVGIGSLVLLAGENSKVVVLALQLFSVIALWFAGKQIQPGGYFGIALLLAMAQIPYQQWILLNHPGSGAIRAYRMNIPFGLTIMLGLLIKSAS